MVPDVGSATYVHANNTFGRRNQVFLPLYVWMIYIQLRPLNDTVVMLGTVYSPKSS